MREVSQSEVAESPRAQQPLLRRARRLAAYRTPAAPITTTHVGLLRNCALRASGDRGLGYVVDGPSRSPSRALTLPMTAWPPS